MKQIIFVKELTDKVLLECFMSQDDFKKSQREGFEMLLNQDNNSDKSAYLLAVMVDKMM